jgi:tripartite-type tricarboxylate transporter receptor subunit TctC
MGFANSGPLKASGVTDTVRNPPLFKVPTMTEVGHENVSLLTRAALFAQGTTDPAIIDRPNKEVGRTLAKPWRRW